MLPFLQQVAAHYFASQDIEHICFVFPNRRSMVFFKKYLAMQVKGGVPMMVPPMYTIRDFFCRVYDIEVTPKLRLLLELYECYRELNPQAEPLDEFVFWGEVLLADFDDVDKYLVNPQSLFQNVADFKGLQDHYEYLSEHQREAIDHFLAHFRDRQGGLSVNLDSPEVKARFLRLWNILYPLYEAFRARLQEKGMAYEGMVYRNLAGRLKEGTSAKDILVPIFPEVKQFVFVGLNALSICEEELLRRMRDAHLAQFVWDYSSSYIRNPANKSSLFMQRNVEAFPQAFELDPEGLRQPEISVISVPSSVGQTKLAPYILSQVSGNPVETAFVLPDESLLLPLLNSIPPQYESVNVTMGYPMQGSAVYTLLMCLGQMQLRLRKKDDQWYFYHKPVREAFSSGLLREILSEEEAAAVARVKADAKYYIPASDLQSGPVLEALFRPVLSDATVASARQNHELERYFSEVVALLGRALTAKPDMLLELDFAKRCHTELNLLQGIDMEVLPATHLRLIDRLLQGISVPFRGEPLQGLQVMGPLETRALDFRNLIILSANEGMFPRRSQSSSFIPPELRKGFGLPTYEYQDAVWAYYFYRMIQRPEKVWLVYDSRTEGLKNGEESRYIKQLEYHFNFPLKRYTATPALMPVSGNEEIPKTPEHVAAIREGELSASTLQSYLFCQARFYYQMVERLKEEEDVAESLDASMLGQVFHAVMNELYDHRPLVDVAYIKGLQKDVAGLRRRIRSQVLEQMHSIEVAGRNLVLEEVILDYVQGVLRQDAQLLESSGSEGFRIFGLERKLRGEFEGFKLKGFADRIDSYLPGQLRIVDYKTGKVENNDILISDDNAAEVVEKLFGPVNTKRPKIALQLFLYDFLSQQTPDLQGQQIVNSIYSTSHLYTGALPDVPASEEFARLVQGRLHTLLEEMTDVSVPFRRTQELSTCEYCAFKSICGR